MVTTTTSLASKSEATKLILKPFLRNTRKKTQAGGSSTTNGRGVTIIWPFNKINAAADKMIVVARIFRRT